MVNIHRGEISSEKVRQGLSRCVPLEDGESILLFADTTVTDKGESGFLVTDRRLVEFTGLKKRHEVRWQRVADVSFVSGFPKRLVLRLDDDRTEEFLLAGQGKELTESVVRAAEAAASGDFSAAAKPLPKDEAAKKAAYQGGEYRLFDAAPEDRESDVLTFVGVLVGAPVLLWLFWWGGHANNVYAVVFRVSFWLGLLAAPFLLFSTLRDALREGPRRVVYGVNRGFVIRKILRGEDDSLWSERTAPEDVDTSGLRDARWSLQTGEVTVSEEAVRIVEKRGRNVAGVENPAAGKVITRDEFRHPSLFDEFAEAVRSALLAAEPSEPASRTESTDVPE